MSSVLVTLHLQDERVPDAHGVAGSHNLESIFELQTLDARNATVSSTLPVVLKVLELNAQSSTLQLGQKRLEYLPADAARKIRSTLISISKKSIHFGVRHC